MTSTEGRSTEPTTHARSRDAAPVSGDAPPSWVAVPRAPFVLLVLLLVVGGVLGILLLNTRINENAFVVSDLQDRGEELDQRQQELEERIAEARSTAELDAAAQRMGLVDLQDELVHLRLSEEGTTRVEEPGVEEPGVEEPGVGDRGVEDPAEGTDE